MIVIRRARGRSTSRWVVTIVGATWVLGACARLTDPPLPSSARALAVPSVYPRWWSMTEACSGLTGALDAVSWYVVPDELGLQRDEGTRGYWSMASNRIVLVAQDTLDGGGVRHEMLHALIRTGGHPRAQFLERCAGTVDCEAACIADAGPAPATDPQAARVAPDSVAVTTEILLAPPTGSSGDGVVTIAIRVHNRAAHAVIVTLPPAGSSGERLGFEYQVWSSSSGGVQSGVNVLDSSSWTFAAGETKQQLFDFASEGNFSAHELPPGQYTVRGAYGGNWSAYVPLSH